MEESQEILLNSLESLGISIPQSVSSVKDLNPTALVSTCAQCLNLLDPTASFPTSLPSDSMADQFKICTDLATRIKNLGFVGDMSFHKVSLCDFNMWLCFFLLELGLCLIGQKVRKEKALLFMMIVYGFKVD